MSKNIIRLLNPSIDQTKYTTFKCMVTRFDIRDGIADAQFELARIEMEMGESQTARQRFAEALDHYTRLDILSKAAEVERLMKKLSQSPSQME